MMCASEEEKDFFWFYLSGDFLAVPGSNFQQAENFSSSLSYLLPSREVLLFFITFSLLSTFKEHCKK